MKDVKNRSVWYHLQWLRLKQRGDDREGTDGQGSKIAGETGTEPPGTAGGRTSEPSAGSSPFFRVH